MKGKIGFSAFAFLAFIILINNVFAVEEGFDVNSLLLKVSIKTGESVNKVLSIGRGSGEQVSLEVIKVPGLKLSEPNFVLNKGESKNVIVGFDSNGLKEGVYVGSIKISDTKNTLYLPVIFEIESEDVFYDINLDIPPQYSTISPGEKLVAQLKIFDLTWGGITQGLGANNVNLEYSVYGSDGSSVVSESESAVVDRQTQITKTITFPKNIKKGDYVFTSVARYKSSVGTASYLFTIGDVKKESQIFGNFDLKFFGILLLIVLVFAGIVLFFIYIIKDRDKLLLEMKKYNDLEFKRQREFILQQEKILRQKKRAPSRKLKDEVNKKISVLKKKHEKRIKVLKELKKDGNTDKMKEQLEQWKKMGYNTGMLEYKLKGLSVNEMKGLIGKWKKEYGA